MNVLYRIGAVTQSRQSTAEFWILNSGWYVFFGKKDGKNYIAMGKLYRSGASRVLGRWHGGSAYYDIYLRKNVSKDFGNSIFLKLRDYLNPEDAHVSGGVTVQQYNDDTGELDDVEIPKKCEYSVRHNVDLRKVASIIGF